MALFKSCPLCGSNLDPGERCNCQQEKECKPGDNRKEKGGERIGGNIAAASGALPRRNDKPVRVG